MDSIAGLIRACGLVGQPAASFTYTPGEARRMSGWRPYTRRRHGQHVKIFFSDSDNHKVGAIVLDTATAQMVKPGVSYTVALSFSVHPVS